MAVARAVRQYTAGYIYIVMFSLPPCYVLSNLAAVVGAVRRHQQQQILDTDAPLHHNIVHRPSVADVRKQVQETGRRRWLTSCARSA